MDWHWWIFGIVCELVLIGVLVWKIHVGQSWKKESHKAHKKQQRAEQIVARYHKAADEFVEERRQMDEDVRTLVTEPAQLCDVCRRLCDPKKDFCYGCGFHVCMDCDDEEMVMGEHGFDQHEKGSVPRGEQE